MYNKNRGKIYNKVKMCLPEFFIRLKIFAIWYEKSS